MALVVVQALLEQVGRRALLEPGIQVILVIPGTTVRLVLEVPQEMQETLARLVMQELVAMVAHEVTAGRLVAAATVAALV